MSNNATLTWDQVETAIAKEIAWLQKTIPLFNTEDRYVFTGKGSMTAWNSYFAYRNIALLIISGKIQANEISSESTIFGPSIATEKHKHGKEWHQKMMNTVEGYFQTNGYKIIPEPHLNYGRADLGIYKNLYKDTYVEIDTVSINKLWLNLQTMSQCVFILVVSERKLIEFQT